MYKKYSVSIVFLVLSLLGIAISGLSPAFVMNEVVNRFIRNGIMVLALIIPIKAGMGLNFAVTVGAMCAQIGYISVIAFGMTGWTGGLFALSISVIIAVGLGRLIGHGLNYVRGKEMITTIVIGLLANGVYQLIFLVCCGGIIPVRNKEILLPRGIGVKNLIDLKAFRNSLDNLWVVEVFDIHFPLFMIGLVLAMGGLLYYLFHTPYGQAIKCVGDHIERSKIVGIQSDKIRVQAMVLSTVLASLGHMIYLQNIGMLNVYTGHLNHQIFASAALLAGGATIKDATVRQAFIGLLLFHALFIVSSQGGQNIFNNPALGEYFRSFVAYGTIAFALVVNLKQEEPSL